jgi:hypothetical protein
LPQIQENPEKAFASSSSVNPINPANNFAVKYTKEIKQALDIFNKLSNKVLSSYIMRFEKDKNMVILHEIKASKISKKNISPPVTRPVDLLSLFSLLDSGLLNAKEQFVIKLTALSVDHFIILHYIPSLKTSSFNIDKSINGAPTNLVMPQNFALSYPTEKLRFESSQRHLEKVVSEAIQPGYITISLVNINKIISKIYILANSYQKEVIFGYLRAQIVTTVQLKSFENPINTNNLEIFLPEQTDKELLKRSIQYLCFSIIAMVTITMIESTYYHIMIPNEEAFLMFIRIFILFASLETNKHAISKIEISTPIAKA